MGGGEEEAHGAVASGEWRVASGQLPVVEAGSMARPGGVKKIKTSSQAPCKIAARLGHTINSEVAGLFDMSVDGSQLLSRLARSDELCWISRRV
jgi:hypothetical protein